MLPQLSPDLTLLLQAQQPPPAWIQFVPLVVILLIFYFIAIAPARKKQQELQRTIDELKKGDRVITNGGIFGEVAGSDERSLVLKVADGVKIKVLKSAIAGLQNDDAGNKS